MCAGEETESIFTVLLPAMLRYLPSSLFVKGVTDRGWYYDEL